MEREYEFLPWKIPDRNTEKQTDHSATSLMGTEMWLSILYLMCDYIGISHLLNFSPKGVHRLYTEI